MKWDQLVALGEGTLGLAVLWAISFVFLAGLVKCTELIYAFATRKERRLEREKSARRADLEKR